MPHLGVKYTMNDIYYFNINYMCNQDCVFCFSHNTQIKNHHNNISIEQFSDILVSNHIQSSDRIIINGGEPTIHPNFIAILKMAVKSQAEVVLYTNGQLLKDESFFQNILSSGIARITIPFHGNRVNHDATTRTQGAYDNLVNGAVPNILKQKRILLEPKFIITHSLIKEKFDFWGFLNENKLINFSKSIVITAQVNTIKARRNKYYFSYDNQFNSYLENQIIILSQEKPVKIFEFKICDFSTDFHVFLQSLKTGRDSIINKFTFF